jgi:hypothetical protein
MTCRATSARPYTTPSTGTLYEVAFAAGAAEVYASLVTVEATLAGLGKQITVFPFKPANDRSVVLYAPAADASSDPVGSSYATIDYAYLAPNGTIYSANGTAAIHVKAVNDAPNKDLLTDQKTVCSSW